MAARKGIRLTAEHARRVADGSLTLSELGAELGISKRTVHYHLRKLGVAGPADGDRPALADEASPGALPTSPAKRRQRPASARSPAPASTSPTAPIGAPSDPAAPATVEIRTADELVEHARRAIAATALAALDRAHEILSKPVGPQGLKATIAAVALAGDQLRRAGYDVTSVGDAQAPRMIILEMTAAEVEATRAEVEAEHRQSFSIEGDELAGDEDRDDEADPRQRAA